MPKLNQFYNKAVKYADSLVGGSARQMKSDNGALNRLREQGIKGISNRAVTETRRKAEVLRKDSNKTRVITGVTAASVGTAGFMGLHKYHQHKDNQILQRIDSMYKNPYN